MFWNIFTRREGKEISKLADNFIFLREQFSPQQKVWKFSKKFAFFASMFLKEGEAFLEDNETKQDEPNLFQKSL